MSNLFSTNLPTEELHLTFDFSTDAPILSIWHTSKIKYTTKNYECQIYFAKISQKSELFGIIVHNAIKYTTNSRKCQVYFKNCR